MPAVRIAQGKLHTNTHNSLRCDCSSTSLAKSTRQPSDDTNKLIVYTMNLSLDGGCYHYTHHSNLISEHAEIKKLFIFHGMCSKQCLISNIAMIMMIKPAQSKLIIKNIGSA